MKKILTAIIVMVIFSLPSRAQYITIPDPALRANILQYHPSCMNASQKMDTTCSEILNATFFFSGEPISDWQGFQYFRNLVTVSIVDDVILYPVLPATVKYLTLQGNNLTDATFPALPAGLLKLDVQGGQLNHLPSLPAELTYLRCWGTNITTLPALPAGLTMLNVGKNYLTSLPLPLPSGIDTLDCSYNGIHQQFTTLPQGLIYFNCGGNFFSTLGSSALPPTLKYLDCSGNELLSNIPAITSDLEYLYAWGDQLTSLPALPASVKEMNVSSNQLTSLPELPVSLRILNCNDNQLVSLSALPALLGTLDCSYNQLTSLPALNQGLHALVCNNNNLVSLPAIPEQLPYIECQYNQLTSLPALPNQFGYLDCSHNQLTSLPTLPHSHMDELWCSHNQLSYLPRLPDSLQRLVCDSNNLTCLPYLPAQLYEVKTDNASCICIPNIPSADCWFTNQGNALFMPLCNPTNNINHCQVFPTMMGYVYNDNNNNNVKDADEPVRANVRVQFSNGTVTYSNNEGQYMMWSDTIGNCTLNCSNPIYFVSLPAQYHYSFLTYDTLVVNNFALQATTIIDSITILAEPINWAARPGFSFPYLISYENSGTTSLTPNIVFNYDNTRLIFDSVSNAAVINTGSSLQLTQPMVAGARNNFTGYFHINPSAVIGDTIFVNAHATANAVDAYDSIYTRIRGSYDPNEKTATPLMSRAQVVAGKYIDYVIRFQNTGTDTAFNIVVTDTLSNLLQKETLQILNASHNCKITQKDDVIYFEFNNILLPDSNVNEQRSHGFVSFRLNPKSFVDNGTNIPNKAAIYFDYNLPVITNTAITEIMTPSGPLPLRLISFNVVRRSKNTASVYWTTANETGMQNFIIETSIDGRNYSGVASQKANDDVFNNYAKALVIGDADIIYFRLKIMSNDGNFTYGPVVTLKKNKTSQAFSFINNPAKDQLAIALNDEALKNTIARIINAQGIVVKTALLQHDNQDIDIRSLPAGVYVLQTVKGSSSFVIRN